MATRVVISSRRALLRRSCFLQTRQYSSAVQATLDVEEADLDNTHATSERGIPFLFLPHTVKKAYTVHEVSTNLPRIFDKYKWLTKTVSSPMVSDNNKLNDSPSANQAFHDSLSQTVAFQKGPKNKDMKRYVPERINFGLVSNFLKISMMENSSKEHLNPSNSLLCNEPILETHWVRNYKFYQTKFRPTFVLKTRRGFDMLEEPQEIHPDDVENIPGPYDPYAMNMYRHPIVHLLNRPCLDNSKFSPFKHSHTTVMVNNRVQSDEQMYSLGMFTMFSQLAAQAQINGVLHGTELKKPIVTQCIVTNGHQIAFMKYQLNTLSMLDDKWVWNRCWYTPVMEMYKKNLSGPWNVYEEAERGESIQGYNADVSKLFVSFIGSETVDVDS